MAEPWDVPRTVEGRGQLEKLAVEYREAGKIRELGICFSRLGYVVKHVGAEGLGAVEASARYGAEAVRLLRQADDKKELIRALRVSAAPFIKGIDYAAILEEALALSREIGDREEEGWTIWRMTLASGVPGYTLEQALECFRSCGCLEGEAACLVSMGFTRVPKNPALLEQAVKLYEKAGNAREAEKTRMMLSVLQ